MTVATGLSAHRIFLVGAEAEEPETPVTPDSGSLDYDFQAETSPSSIQSHYKLIQLTRHVAVEVLSQGRTHTGSVHFHFIDPAMRTMLTWQEWQERAEELTSLRLVLEAHYKPDLGQTKSHLKIYQDVQAGVRVVIMTRGREHEPSVKAALPDLQPRQRSSLDYDFASENTPASVQAHTCTVQLTTHISVTISTRGRAHSGHAAFEFTDINTGEPLTTEAWQARYAQLPELKLELTEQLEAAHGTAFLKVFEDVSCGFRIALETQGGKHTSLCLAVRNGNM